MSRPTTIRDEDILEAARAVFLERGLAAPTADVAQRAGISEGSIFKRWPSKAALVHAALDVNAIHPTWIDRLEAAMTAQPPEPVSDVLQQVSTEALEFYRRLVPTMMMRWSAQSMQAPPCGDFDPARAGEFIGEPPPLRTLRVLTAYFELEASRGCIATPEPEVPARMLAGALFQYAAFEVMLRARNAPSLDAAVFIRQMVDTLLHGMRVKGGEHP